MRIEGFSSCSRCGSGREIVQKRIDLRTAPTRASKRGLGQAIARFTKLHYPKSIKKQPRRTDAAPGQARACASGCQAALGDPKRLGIGSGFRHMKISIAIDPINGTK
jgi:hypothetical protein